MISGGKQTLPADNSKSVMSAQVSYLGQVKEMPFITPYGLFSSPPINSTWVVIPLRNNADDVVGFGNDYANKPPLLSGEVCLYNTQTKSKITLDYFGNVNIDASVGMNVTAKGNVNITATGNATVTSTTATINATTAVINATTSATINTATANINATTALVVEAPLSIFRGNVIINGTLTATGLITGLNFTDGVTLYNTHVHHVSSAPSNSGPAI